MARIRPEAMARRHSRRVSLCHSSRHFVSAKGARMSEAMVKRQAAMASEDIVPCASRMKVEAVEDAVIPIARTRAGGTFGLVIMGVFVNVYSLAT